MSQMTGTDGTRSRLTEIGGKLLQLFGDIGCHITLFLYVLIAPTDIIAERHGASQSHRAPLLLTTRQQDFGSSSEPHTTLGGRYQTDHHAGVTFAGTPV